MDIKYVIVERKMMGRYVALRGLSFASREEAQAHIDSTFGERYRNRYTVETRAIKEDDAGERMHCQCCGRAILANRGKIALHGYTRPGHGWQTASCYGANRLPWEVDRSALADLIAFLKTNLAGQIAGRAAVADETAEVTHNYRHYDRKISKTVSRALTFTRATFEGVKAADPDGQFPYYNTKTFDDYKATDLADRDQSIKMIRRDIAEFTKRYEGWTQTHERKGREWVRLAV